MIDYKNIRLTKNEEELLKVFLKSDYKVIDKDDMWGLRATGIDGEEEKCLLLCGLSCFRWVKDDEQYEIEKLLNPPHEPKTVWDLEEGDAFWWVDSCGGVNKDTWENCKPDYDRRNQGNAFLTKKEAKFESKRREVVTKVRKYARPFEKGEMNFFPCYDCVDDLITFNFDEYYKPPVDYFCSNEDIQKAIAEVGEEKLKKYYLGVVEQ